MLIATLIAVALLSTACGSSSNSGSTGGDTKSSAPTNASANQAAAAIQPFLKPPTSIGTSVALTKAPPTGKHIVAIACSVQSCQEWGTQVEIAAKALGWTSEFTPFGATPEDINAAVKLAVQAKHPDAILINGVPRQTFTEAATLAAQNHIPIVTQMGELQGAATAPFIAVQYQGDKFDTMSTATGNWVIADSNGKANALLVQYSGLPLSERITSTTKKTIDTNCPDCKTQVLTAQLADTGTKLPSSIVSALQRDRRVARGDRTPGLPQNGA
jgi:ABC-type sugar transport system substrate-binding protein